MNTLPEKQLSQINEIITYMLTTNLTGYENNLLNYLYDIICPKLVKHSSDIYTNNKEKKDFCIESTRTILSEYFDLFSSIPISLPDEIINLFKDDVIKYFDLFIKKTIILWHVNIENIFKYFINNYRCFEIISNLVN